MRGLCGLTLRERAALGDVVATPYGGGELVARRAADGMRVVRLPRATLFTRERVDERGFRGGAADAMARALEAEAPWLQAARRAPRGPAALRIPHWAPWRILTDGTTSLIRAAVKVDERRVRELLAAGAPLRCIDGYGRTALHYASAQGDARSVAALMEADAAGVTLDAQDRGGFTPLMIASEDGRVGAVCALLARGARQTWRNIRGGAALHEAARGGHASIVELLCAAPGAATALALRDRDGHTPLAVAVLTGHDACAAVLRAHGAS
jgi:hypothetical protein